MLISDIHLVTSLVACALIAFFARRHWLVAAAVTALIAGLLSVFRNSWQAAPGLVAAILILAIAALSTRPASRPIRWLRGVLATFAALLTAASAALFYFLPIFVLPSPDGPHAVGTRQFDLIDLARTGVMEDAPGIPRRILVRAWYPAASTEGFATRPYLTPQEIDDHAIDVFSDFGLPHFVYRHFSLVRTHSHVDAPLAASEQLPVVVFNHGYWCWPGQNTALMEKLASHGFLVFSIGHPYDGGTMTFADGLKIPVAPNKKAAQVPTQGMLDYWTGADHETRYAALHQYQLDFDQHRVMRSFNAWRGDLRFFVDQLTSRRLPANAADLQRAADPERIGFAGMSFGGTSSASACHHDERCKAAVNLDGEEFDWSLYDAAVRMPLAVLHADWVRYPPFGPNSGHEEFNILCDYAYERWGMAGANNDVVRARLVGARHLGLTDLPLSARGALGTRLYGAGDPEQLVAATNDYVLGFFQTHLVATSNRNIPGITPDLALERHPGLLTAHRLDSVREWWTKR